MLPGPKIGTAPAAVRTDGLKLGGLAFSLDNPTACRLLAPGGGMAGYNLSLPMDGLMLEWYDVPASASFVGVLTVPSAEINTELLIGTGRPTVFSGLTAVRVTLSRSAAASITDDITVDVAVWQGVGWFGHAFTMPGAAINLFDVQLRSKGRLAPWEAQVNGSAWSSLGEYPATTDPDGKHLKATATNNALATRACVRCKFSAQIVAPAPYSALTTFSGTIQ